MSAWAALALAAVPSACPAADLSALAPADRALVAEALVAACGTVRHPAFRDLLTRQRLERACPARRGDPAQPVAPATVLADLARMPAFALSVEPLAGPTLRAETSAFYRHIRIAPWWLQRARTDGARGFAALVGTLLHEQLHLVPDPADGRVSRYQDAGFAAGGCHARRLASYAVGDLAERVWLADHAPGRGG